MKSSIVKTTVFLQLVLLINFINLPAFAYHQQQFKIVNMNIHCFNDDWQFRLSHILDKFIEISPELIALQEVCENPQARLSQIEFIRNYLSQRNYHIQSLAAQYTHKAWDRDDEYIVLISKVNVEVVDQGFLPQSLLQRGYVGFRINQNWYITTHLEYRADNAHYRKSQIEFLMGHFANQPHLIIGDFNSSPGSLEQAGLQTNGYFSIFPGESHQGNDGNASKVIDGLWVSPQMYRNIEYINGSVILNHKVQDRFLSDHFAVFAHMKFKTY
jgi:endonuclease/exonuclease/phosphatase family metal-dependent hydrolase